MTTDKTLKEIKEEIKNYFKDNKNFISLNSYDYTDYSSINLFFKKDGTFNKFNKWLKHKDYFKSINKKDKSPHYRFKHNAKMLLTLNVYFKKEDKINIINIEGLNFVKIKQINNKWLIIRDNEVLKEFNTKYSCFSYVRKNYNQLKKYYDNAIIITATT